MGEQVILTKTVCWKSAKAGISQNGEKGRNIEQIKEARSLVICPNAEYDEAKNEQARVERNRPARKIAMQYGEPVEETVDHSVVSIGTVRILDLSTVKRRNTTSSVRWEADADNVISQRIAWGAALISKSVGDIAEVLTPSGEILKFKIIDIYK